MKSLSNALPCVQSVQCRSKVNTTPNPGAPTLSTTTLGINDTQHIAVSITIMLNVAFIYYCAECRYTKRRCAERRGAQPPFASNRER